MNELTKVQAFEELFQLIIFYSEHRDLPVDEDFDFFEEVKKYCKILDLDYKAFKDTFHLKEFTNLT